MNFSVTVGELWKPVDSPVCLCLYFSFFSLSCSEVWCSRISKRFLFLSRTFTSIISSLLFCVIMHASHAFAYPSVLWDSLLWHQATFPSSEFFSFSCGSPHCSSLTVQLSMELSDRNPFTHSTGMANIFSSTSPQGFTIYVYVLKQNLTESC